MLVQAAHVAQAVHTASAVAAAAHAASVVVVHILVVTLAVDILVVVTQAVAEVTSVEATDKININATLCYTHIFYPVTRPQQIYCTEDE